MRKALVIGVALAFAGAAASQASDLAVFGSYWDTDELEESLGGGLKLSIGDGPWVVDLRASHFPDLTRDIGDIVEDPDVEGSLDVKATPLEAGFAYRFQTDTSFRPFVGGGGTYFMLDTNRFELDDEVGYYVAGGFDTGGDNVGFFAEALYRKVEATLEAEAEDLDDIDDLELVNGAEVDLSGVGINAGVVFRF
jgi:hypothetical protein